MADEWQTMDNAPKDGTEVLVKWRRFNNDNPRELLAPEVTIAYWIGLWGSGSESWHGRGPTRDNWGCLDYGVDLRREFLSDFLF